MYHVVSTDQCESDTIILRSYANRIGTVSRENYRGGEGGGLNHLCLRENQTPQNSRSNGVRCVA